MARALILVALLALAGAATADERGAATAPAASRERAPAAPLVDPARLKLRSGALLVLEHNKGKVLVARNAEAVMPIASITKLMTAMVILDARPRMDELLEITEADVDHLKGTHSRLRVGTRLSRRELLRLALMSSENRAASALSRNYPGGAAAFVDAMNRKAEALGMTHSHFYDVTGLTPRNVSTAHDLARMVHAASNYTLIREFTTTSTHAVRLNNRGAKEVFRNSNRLIQARSKDWKIGLSKTGYTAEAGRCLVMQASIGARPVTIVLLNGAGKLTPIGDANRIRRWMQSGAGSKV